MPNSAFGDVCGRWLICAAAGRDWMPETQTKIDRLVVALVERQHQKALQILRDDRQKLDELAKFLHEKETITGEEFMSILNA